MEHSGKFRTADDCFTIIVCTGDKSFAWMFVTPRLYVLEPALIKEIFTRIDEFHKPPTDPTFKKLAGGIITLNDEKWVKHRKLLSPAFHLQKLKVTFC